MLRVHSAAAAAAFARMQARVAQRQAQQTNADAERAVQQTAAQTGAAADAAAEDHEPAESAMEGAAPAEGGGAPAAESAPDSPRSWPPSAARRAPPAAAAAAASSAAADESGDVSMQSARSDRPLLRPSSSPAALSRDRQHSDDAAASSDPEEQAEQEAEEADEPAPHVRSAFAAEYTAQPRLSVATARRPLVPVEAVAPQRVSFDLRATSPQHAVSQAASTASSPMGIGAAIAAQGALNRGQLGAAASTYSIAPMARNASASANSIDGVSFGRPSTAASMSSLQRSFRRQQQEDAREFAMEGQESSGRPWMAVLKPQAQAQIGVAYFSAEEETLLGGEFNSMEAVQRLKQQLAPDTIITNATTDDALYRALQDNEANPAFPFSVRHLKKIDFGFESSVQTLRSLHVDDFADAVGADPNSTFEMDKRSQTMMFKSFIDFRKTNMVCAMGGLIRSIMVSGAFSGADALHVRSVSSIPVDVLEVDASTLDSLSIFVADMHPGRGGVGGKSKEAGGGGEGGLTLSGQTSSGPFKEGFSVYSLLNETKTTHGARLLRQWVRYPSTNMEIIQERQDHVEYFAEQHNTDLVGTLRTHLRHIKDLSRLIMRFRTKPAKRADWKAMRNGLNHLLSIGSLLHSRNSSSPSLLRDLCSLNLQPLSEIRNEIEDVVELLSDEDARAQARETGQPEPTNVCVKRGISEKLDAMRDTHAALAEILAERSEMDRVELASLALGNPSPSPSHPMAQGLSAASPSTPTDSFFLPQDLLSLYHLVYLPQLGFLARLPLRPGVTDAATTIPNFEFKFRTEAEVFYKNQTTEELDEEHGDIENLIHDLQNSILRDVQEHLVSVEDLLRQSNGMLAELDCFVALALVSFQHKLVRPRMVNDPSVLMIRNGRHLLMEKKIDGFVYNSTHMAGKGAAGAASVSSSPNNGGASSRVGGEIHLITGPNASGKTVYLKQVGIIVYLAHIGSFVPADSATIGLCDRILTRVTSVDSSFSSLSSFMYDSSQISYMLRHATPRSLLLIDEFGKGTGNLDGISLMAATLHHLERRGADCPKTLITTHFHELFQMGLIKESNTISFWKMRYCEQEADDEPADGDVDAVRGASSSSSSTPKLPFGSRHYAKRQHREGAEAGHGKKKRLPKVICLYQLVPGQSEWSFGPACAVAAGVSESLMLRAVEVSKDIQQGRTVSAATESASSPNRPSSSAASTATPSSVHPAEQELWYDYLAFVLHASAQRSVDLATIRAGVPLTDADQLAANLARSYGDKDMLQRLTEQFMQQHKQRIIALRAPPDENGIGLESVD